MTGGGGGAETACACGGEKKGARGRKEGGLWVLVGSRGVGRGRGTQKVENDCAVAAACSKLSEPAICRLCRARLQQPGQHGPNWRERCAGGASQPPPSSILSSGQSGLGASASVDLLQTPEFSLEVVNRLVSKVLISGELASSSPSCPSAPRASVTAPDPVWIKHSLFM
jgi:hypothetical protein